MPILPPQVQIIMVIRYRSMLPPHCLYISEIFSPTFRLFSVDTLLTCECQRSLTSIECKKLPQVGVFLVALIAMMSA